MGYAGGLGGEEEFGFRKQGVDGVHKNVAGVRGEEIWGGVGIDEEGKGGDRRVGVDIAEKACGRFCLGAAEGGLERERMAVEVGKADFVEVDQNEAADGGPGKGFGGCRADGAQAGDDDAGAGETSDGIGAEQKTQAFEGWIHRDQTSTEGTGRGTKKRTVKENHAAHGTSRMPSGPGELSAKLPPWR